MMADCNNPEIFFWSFETKNIDGTNKPEETYEEMINICIGTFRKKTLSSITVRLSSYNLYDKYVSGRAHC